MPLSLWHRMYFSIDKRREAPVFVNSRQRRKGGIAMTNIDYCGIVNLLRQLVEKDLLTRQEARKIAARIAAEEQVDMILFV